VTTIVDGNSGGTAITTSTVGWQRIAADAVPVNTASISFTGIPSSVKHLKVLHDYIGETNGVTLNMRVSQGGVFDTSSSYGYVGLYANNAGTVVANSFGPTYLPTSVLYFPINGTATAGAGGEILFTNLQSTARVRVDCTNYSYHTSDATVYLTRIGMFCPVAGAIAGVQFFFTGGNITSGRITLLGLNA